jgi:hypothetical protein
VPKPPSAERDNRPRAVEEEEVLVKGRRRVRCSLLVALMLIMLEGLRHVTDWAGFRTQVCEWWKRPFDSPTSSRRVNYF